MLINCNLPRLALTLVVVALFGVSLATPVMSSVDTISIVNTYHVTEDSGRIDGVPYVWQEINGYCYWAAVTMALKTIGIDFDLYGFFAASGIGFSAAYIMIDDVQLFISGSAFRQQQQIPVICEVLGVEHVAYFDSNSPWIQVAEPLWVDAEFNIEMLDGSDEAFQQLRDTIDEGYPAVLWVDPYWLPAEDYEVLRDLMAPQDPAAPSSGHAIVVTGYNDTSQTVEILDPGVGAFGENFGYPDDGRYSYTANYSTLDLAWNTLGYGNVVFKPGPTVENQEERLGNFIVDRLLGNRTSYAPDLEELFFAGFGESAFRGLSLDTTVEGIRNYLGNYNDTDDWVRVLATTGASHEQFMTLQYPSYRAALEALPSLMPSYDLTEVIELGKEAYPHMAALSTNDSMVSLNYAYDGSELTTTYFALANSYQTTEDIDVTLEAYSDEIQSLANHFLAIADSWKAAGEALQLVLEGEGFLTPQMTITLLGATSTLLIVGVVVVRRRGR